MVQWDRALTHPRSTADDGEFSAGSIGPERLFWSYPYSPKWPFFIHASGNSAWVKGNFYRRKGCRRTCVEVVTAGNLRFKQNGREYLVAPGQCIVLHMGSDHVYATGPAGFVRKRFVMLEGTGVEMLFHLAGLDRIDVFTLDNMAPIVSYIKTAQRLLRDKPSDCERLISLQAYAIVNELIAASTVGHSPPVRTATAIIQRDPHRAFTNGSLAREVGVSPAYLVRIFREQTGRTPRTYHRLARISLARELLGRTRVPIKEIALRIGFDDPLYFSRVFKKETGISPRDYRSA